MATSKERRNDLQAEKPAAQEAYGRGGALKRRGNVFRWTASETEESSTTIDGSQKCQGYHPDAPGKIFTDCAFPCKTLRTPLPIASTRCAMRSTCNGLEPWTGVNSTVHRQRDVVARGLATTGTIRI